MKKATFSFIILVIAFSFNVLAQNSKLTIEFIKTGNEYLKTLDDGRKECSFYIKGIASKNKAEEIQNYIRGYRGVEQFNLFELPNGYYIANGIFYSFANAQYFKNLFKLLNAEKIIINNQQLTIEEFNTL